MDKILVELFVPALSETYELFLPADVPLGQLMPVIINGVCSMSSSRYISSGEELLCAAEAGLLENLGMTAGQYGLKNGDSLMLV